MNCPYKRSDNNLTIGKDYGLHNVCANHCQITRECKEVCISLMTPIASEPIADEPIMTFETWKEAVDNELFDRYHLSLVDLFTRYEVDTVENELIDLYCFHYTISEAVYDIYRNLFYGV